MIDSGTSDTCLLVNVRHQKKHLGQIVGQTITFALRIHQKVKLSMAPGVLMDTLLYCRSVRRINWSRLI